MEKNRDGSRPVCNVNHCVSIDCDRYIQIYGYIDIYSMYTIWSDI